MKLFHIIATLLAAAAPSSRVSRQTYQSVLLDSAGQLSITLSSGSVIIPPKLGNQTSFSQPLISADHRIVAWLANYVDPSAPQGSGDPVAERLVLYKAGHVLRSFGTDQTFWSWQFTHHDRDVAFCTGPTHGGASGCALHRIGSGALRAKWDPHSADAPPLWAKGLNY